MPESGSLRRLTLVATAVLVVAGLVAAAPLPWSDPVGIYAIVDRVVMEPDATSPKAVQIWGVFAVTEAKPGDAYRAPERGYFYYSINPQNERATLAEWTDLKAVAGKNQAVGFGSKYRPLGRLRPAAEAATGPDVYPLGLGLVKVLNATLLPDVERQLKAAAVPPKATPPAKRPPAGAAH